MALRVPCRCDFFITQASLSTQSFCVSCPLLVLVSANHRLFVGCGYGAGSKCTAVFWRDDGDAGRRISANEKPAWRVQSVGQWWGCWLIFSRVLFTPISMGVSLLWPYSAFHPSGVDKWVLIHSYYMDYGGWVIKRQTRAAYNCLVSGQSLWS